VTPLSDNERERFDALFDLVVEVLPASFHELLEEMPVVIDDEPSAELRRQLDLPTGADLCGLHTGIALTDRSVEQSGVPSDVIRLFRRGIILTARGRRTFRSDADGAVREEIRITLLHEIGHHFGLTEDDLDDLGYG